MTAIIIEDEIPAAYRLQKLLIGKNFVVLEILNSVKTATTWLQNNNHPDCVFIDIKLRDGNCFEILDKVEINSKIIFTTAYNEFALDAFKYNSIDYLLKPIVESKLDKLVEKIETLKNGFQKEISWLDFEVNNFKSIKKTFLVARGSTLKKIDESSIVCFFSENNASYLLADDGRNYVINYSLDKLEAEVNAALFFRINRKFIINKNYIINLKNDFKKQVFLSHSTNFEFVISKLKTKSFLNWYKK